MPAPVNDLSYAIEYDSSSGKDRGIHVSGIYPIRHFPL